MAGKKKVGICHYHLCRKKTDVYSCKHCDKNFCKEHITSKPAMMIDYKLMTKKDRDFIDRWSNVAGHPCPPYTDYLHHKEEEDVNAYAATLDRLNNSKRSKTYKIEMSDNDEKYYSNENSNKSDCSYHLCKRRVAESNCQYCKKSFCNEHLTANIPGRKSNDGHPCPSYYDYMKRHETSEEPKSKSRETDEVRKEYQTWNSIKRWFHKRSSYNDSFDWTIFLKNLLLLVVAMIVSAVAYLSVEYFNEITIWFIPLGTLIFIASLIWVLMRAIKTFRSVKRLWREMRYGYKAVILIALVVGAFYLYGDNDTHLTKLSDIANTTKTGISSIFSSNQTQSPQQTTGTSSGNQQTSSKNPFSKSLSKPSVNPLSLELKIHEGINAQRVKYGLPVLSFDSRLAAVARSHSQDMANRNYFSHDTPEGVDPTGRADRAGYSCYKNYGSYYTDGIGENIFQNNLYDSITYWNGIPSYNWNTEDEIADSTVVGWMDSPGHRENILTSIYDRQGIGVAISSDDKVYITENFC